MRGETGERKRIKKHDTVAGLKDREIRIEEKAVYSLTWHTGPGALYRPMRFGHPLYSFLVNVKLCHLYGTSYTSELYVGICGFWSSGRSDASLSECSCPKVFRVYSCHSLSGKHLLCYDESGNFTRFVDFCSQIHKQPATIPYSTSRVIDLSEFLVV